MSSNLALFKELYYFDTQISHQIFDNELYDQQM